MAGSIKSLQDSLVNDSFLDDLGNDKKDYAALNQFPTLEKFMIRAAAQFISDARKELDRQGKVASGGLSDGLDSGELIKSMEGYLISVGYDPSDPSSKYYDFVNQGVSGFDRSVPGTPYKFKKKLNKKGGILVGAKMQKSLLMWYKFRGSIGSNDDQKSNLSANQKRDKSLSKVRSQEDKLKSIAYATAVNIKKKGIERSGFFDKTIKSTLGQEFLNALTKIVGQDVKASIRQTANKQNDKD